MPDCPFYLTREQARTLDRRAMEELGIPGIVLMENAGRGMADLLRSLGIGGPVVVCCGKGNNGGDGLVIARHLANAGAAVRVLLFTRPESLTGDAALAYRAFLPCGIETVLFDASAPDENKLRLELALADWVVDGLFGSGLEG